MQQTWKNGCCDPRNKAIDAVRELCTWKPVAGVLRALLVICVLSSALIAGAADKPGPPLAVADDIAFGIRFVLDDGPISAGEPVIAAVDITNRGGETVEVLLGSNEVPALCVEIRREVQVLAATPRPERRPDGLCGMKTLEPGATYTSYWVITAMHDLNVPGQYELGASLVNWMDWTVLSEARVVLHVEAFDPKRLDSRCYEIYQSPDLPSVVRSRAICSVRNEIALPYLDAMASTQGSAAACLAIRRIGTERANALFEALASRNDRVGETAREAREMDLGTSMWDVLVW